MIEIIKTNDGYMVQHMDGELEGECLCDASGNNLFDTYEEADAVFWGKPTSDNETPPLEWQALWDAMDAHPTEWIQTTEKMYWQMLEAVPPRAHSNGAFLVGEASHSNAEGRTMYAGFKKTGGQFYAKYLTIDQFKKEF